MILKIRLWCRDEEDRFDLVVLRFQSIYGRLVATF